MKWIHIELTIRWKETSYGKVKKIESIWMQVFFSGVFYLIMESMDGSFGSISIVVDSYIGCSRSVRSDAQ